MSHTALTPPSHALHSTGKKCMNMNCLPFNTPSPYTDRITAIRLGSMGGTELGVQTTSNDKCFTISGQGWRSVGDVNTTTPDCTV